MAHFLPRVSRSHGVCWQLSDISRLSFGLAADDETAGTAIAIVDFNYVDTSGEVRDQRASMRCDFQFHEHAKRTISPQAG